MKARMNDLNIPSGTALARLALDLGAGSVGGLLAAEERALIAEAMREPACEPAMVEVARTRITAGGDPLGDAFTAVRSPLTRRAIGAFYTPPAIVEPMVRWALSKEPTRFVDPGSGSGRFAVAAVRANSDIAVVAVDLDPLATLLTRANLAVLEAKDPIVLNADYLTVRIAKHEGRTAWVGNPPYVRHHELTPAAKRWSAKAGKRLGHGVSGLAGLHALFFMATALRAQKGDVGCFVTSAEWLDVGYGSVVRDLLLNGLGGSSLDLIDPKAIPFADAMTTALITSFEAGSEPSAMAVHLVSDPADLRLGDGSVIETKVFAGTSRWSPLFRAGDLAIGETLGDLARVHRGVATGANGFFTMTKAEAETRGLTRWAKPAITGAVEVLGSGGVVHDSPGRRVLIDIPADVDRKAEPAADAYLKEGERQKIDRRYLCAHRKPWWRLGASAPPLVASYMARQAPAFALNPDGLVLLNIAHGIWPEEADPKVLVERLNKARATFAGSGRTYHGGLEKFEPREMEALVLP
jgi:adenine-specific DNA-methyltransferase